MRKDTEKTIITGRYVDRHPLCHFKAMSYEMAEGDEAWYECKICGSIRDADTLEVICPDTGKTLKRARTIMTIPSDPIIY